MSTPGSGVPVDQTTHQALVSLAIGNTDLLGEMGGVRAQMQADSSLDPKTFALVKIGALVALDAAPASYMWQVTAALEAGATPAEILGVLTAVAPQTGMPRVVAAAPEIMLALGLDVPAEPGI